uniref:Carbohydrate sulfotransferase n=1 Tax=Kryptolebias marmoratus TaxID=37003 RepID=A0A3Q3F4Z4_KRYMA
MTICSRLIKYFGLLGSVFLILLMSYGWHMSQEKEGKILFTFLAVPAEQFFSIRTVWRLYQLQDLRKQLVQEQCREHKKANLKGNTLEDLSQSKLKNFIVDDKHGIIYCYIPKVACTNWKRVLYALNQGEPYPDLVSIKSSTVHKQFKFTLLNDYSRTEIKVSSAKLRHYTKFLFVRDPFVRLVSAYRDKLGIRPSFYNFIQYLLDPQTERSAPFEPHWRQMHRLCHPCLIEYDFIGHQETLQDDAPQLLKMLKLEDSITFPSAYENVTDQDFLLNWFRAAPLEDRRKLYELYEEDFRLFGYRRPSELLDD